METFRFKQFSVSHRHSFKVGTDAVLLGALTPVGGCAEDYASRHFDRINTLHCERRELVLSEAEAAIQGNFTGSFLSTETAPFGSLPLFPLAFSPKGKRKGKRFFWGKARSFTERKRALDIGCGSGIIALMLLQRGVSSVVGIEIDPLAAAEAAENAKKSIWNDRIQMVCGDFCNPETVRDLFFFDLIVSNPPFFSNALKSPDSKRNATRHNDETLPFETLIQNAVTLLSDNGLFSLILPVPEAELFLQIAASRHLFPTEIHHIFSKPHKPESRQILVLKKQPSPQPFVEKSLCVYQTDGSYSEAYKALTAGFYLGF